MQRIDVGPIGLDEECDEETTMFPMSCKAGGNCFAFPDVCKTPAPPAPPIPIPYPNIAQVAQAVKTGVKVKVMNQPALNKGSEIPMSQGDEAGVAGGVTSGVNMQVVKYVMGYPKVKVEGMDAVGLMSTTGHNGSSANMPAGQQIAPSQAKVIIIP